jgi:O-acetylhomoserine/O-acetylserine sulfhydrylase-like pyridoxal-dependent enzyme
MRRTTESDPPEHHLLHHRKPELAHLRIAGPESVAAGIAKEHGIITLCDNSYNSPLFQNPIDLGIDLVAHSATKYLNGHSDVVAGVLAEAHAFTCAR